MPAAKPVLILQTGDAPPAVSRQTGNYARLFLAAAGLRPEQAAVVHLPSGHRPAADPQRYGGILITGSSAMVTEHQPWSEFAARWLRQAMAAAVPIFGVCYGHQLLAYALGGEVDYHPQGMEIGTHTIELLPAAQNDPLLASLPRRFPANLIHSQTVLTSPPGAMVLARSAQDAHQILRYSDNVITVQFHPEFTDRVMRAFRHCMTERELIRAEYPVGDTPDSRALLARFVQQSVFHQH